MKTKRIVVLLAITTVFILCGSIVLNFWHRLFGAAGVLPEGVQLFLSRVVFRVGDQSVRVFFLIKAALFLIFLNLVARVVRRVLAPTLHDHPRIDSHHEYLLLTGISAAIYVIGLLVGIWVEGIDLTTLIVIGGTVGVVLGLGLQSLASNFIAGATLLIEQPVRIGDRIEFGGKSGDVVKVGSRSSTMRTDDNVLMIIPNSDLTTKPFLNLSASGENLRIAIPVPVAYGSESREVIQNLLDLANGHTEVLASPAPSVLLLELGTRCVMFSLRVWTAMPARELPLLQSDLQLAILQRFKEKNIEMPPGHLDLQVNPHDAAALPVEAVQKLRS